MKSGGDPICLGRQHPWRVTVAATAFVLGALCGAVFAWLAIFFTEAR